MEILERAKTPHGIEIQLEDWDGELTIGAYPIAQNSSQTGYIKKGKIFRLAISMNRYKNYSNEEVKADFEALKTGEKTPEDLSDHFYNAQKDMYYLGMNVENKGY